MSFRDWSHRLDERVTRALAKLTGPALWTMVAVALAMLGLVGVLWMYAE